MNQTFKDKMLADADRESRIVAFLNAMPNDMEPSELECAVIAIANAYIPEKILPNFFVYLAMRVAGADIPNDADRTAH